MKVLNLRCGNDHLFEGWFGSDEDFQAQETGGRVECPLCGDRRVARMPSAPRLHVSNRRVDVEEAPAAVQTPAQAQQARMQGQWLQAMRHMLASTEDVGERFPEEARRIHYGEVEERGIRGQATPEDAEALREEGIEVVALPMPAALKGPVQ
jgi:hypothetical protein